MHLRCPILITTPSSNMDGGSTTVTKKIISHAQDNIASRLNLCGYSSKRRNSDILYDEEIAIFRMLQDEKTHLVSLRALLSALLETGLRKTDPRLKSTFENIEMRMFSDTASPDSLMVDIETFRSVVGKDIKLVGDALRHKLVIPEFPEFIKVIAEIYQHCKENKSGHVATYIPQLAKVDPNYWGISLCTVDGQRFSIGDVHIPFTIQSCSKPLTYALALELLGEETVHTYIGHEPSGRNFNELVLDPNKKPHNPMINAGAIIICSLINTLVYPEMTAGEKFDFTLNFIRKLAGGEGVGYNNSVFLSESETGDRNYALAYYMKENKCFPKNFSFKQCIEFYFQCCSIESTCEAFSIVAATLANGGICPLTDEKVLSATGVRDCLSLMYSCGMYDYSGRFAFKIGLPAKSGVSGALLIVIPNVMGVCTFGPSLDELGNSCKGIEFCKQLTARFNFHKYDILKHVPTKFDPRMYKFEDRGLSVVHLLYCAAHGDILSLKRQKLAGMDMSVQDYDSRTALHLAAAQGNLQCVEFLVNICGVSVNVQDRWGHTPLSEAKMFGHTEVVKFLESCREE